MKKLVIIIISIMIFVCISPLIAYGAAPSLEYSKKVDISKDQNEFTIDIAVNNENQQYAGAEFGVQCAEGVKIKSVVYNMNSARTAVTEANGLTWFSFFSGKNDFKDKVIATLSLEYSGEENTSIIINNVSVYTKRDSVIDTYKIKNSNKIEIYREGSTNEIPPLTPPDDGDDNSDNDNDNDSENNEDMNESEEGNFTSNSAKKNKQVTSNSSNSNNNENDDSINEGNGSNDDTSDESYVNKEKKVTLVNKTISVALGISVIFNLIIGYLYINTKLKHKKEQINNKK